MDGLKSLARCVEFAVAGMPDWATPCHHGIVYALAEVRGLIDEFPDEEVDDLFCAELRKHIDANGGRLIAIGQVLKVNFLYPESWPDAQAEKYSRWRAMLAA